MRINFKYNVPMTNTKDNTALLFLNIEANVIDGHLIEGSITAHPKKLNNIKDFEVLEFDVLNAIKRQAELPRLDIEISNLTINDLIK